MSHKKKFIGLNTKFRIRTDSSFREIEIDDEKPLLDYDCVIVNTENLIGNYSRGAQEYEQKLLLTEEESNKIFDDFIHIKSQLIDLLKQGKNVYVLLGNNPNCYIWRKNEGKRKVTSFYTYSFLPIEPIYFDKLSGSNFKIVNTQFKVFFEKNKSEIYYKQQIEEDEDICPILKVDGTDRVVSAFVNYEKGKVVILPYLTFTKYYDPESQGKKERFINSLIELDQVLTTQENGFVYPDWIDDFNILTETDDLKQLNNLENEKNELLKRIEKQKECLELLKKYKGLFTSSGKQLENIVKEVFEKVGFQVFPSEPNRTDVIAKYNDTDVVMEIKGLTKSAAEKNAAQLEKWVSMFIEKEERTPKPLLIVNAFCDTPLEQRIENVFPNQMLSYSTSRNHCLISTTQLLCLFIEVTQKPECKEGCINELLTTVGIYNRYTDYTPFIKKVK